MKSNLSLTKYVDIASIISKSKLCVILDLELIN